MTIPSCSIMESNTLEQNSNEISSPDTEGKFNLSEQSLYVSHFGLNEKPFKLTPDPKFFYMSKEHQEALAHLVFSIQENKGFVTITGEVGTGKTTLCRSFISHLEENIKVAYIFNPCLTDIELLQTINDEFAIPSNQNSKKFLIDKLNKYLLKEKLRGNKVVIIIDEAQNLTPNVLEQLRLLSNLETETEKLIQIILVGQPELEVTLSRPDLRQLKQRITIDWELLPLDKEETATYIQHRTKVAGGDGKLTFTRDAMGKIYGYSQGTPRLINVLADRALIIAFALGKREINLRIIQHAIKDIERKPNKPHKNNNSTKVYILSGLLFIAFTYLGVSTYLSKTNAPLGVPEVSVTQSDTNDEATTLTREVPMIEKEPAPREQPILTAVSSLDIPPESAPKRVFADLLNQTSEQSRISAIIALLERWKLPPLAADELAGLKLSRLKNKRGLSFFSISTDLQKLEIFNYPAMLTFQSKSSKKPVYLLLIAVLNDQLVFLLNGEEIEVNRDKVKELWTGRAYILWKNFENIDRVLKKGTRGFDVAWLSKKLKEFGFYKQKTTSVFNNNLKKAVIRFQKEHLLKADGVVGKETKIILYNKTGVYKTPQLSKR